MNLTFGNLTTLKRALLPVTWQGESEKDVVLETLGKGVAGAIEAYCQRKFARETADTEDFPGNETALVVRRYPLEEKPSLTYRDPAETSFTTVTDYLDQWFPNSGLLVLSGAVGSARGLLRVTMKGGYWFDDSEDDSGTQPTGSNTLPNELQRAWLEQCRHVWTVGKLFGDTGENRTDKALDQHDLLPTVRMILNPYRRMTL